MKSRFFNLFFALLCVATTVCAQQPGVTSEHDVDANNPLATIKSANLQMYYMPSLYGMTDATMTQTLIRYAQPAGQFILRASLPFETFSAPDVSPVSGLGDLNVFGIYKFKLKKPGTDLGIGPTITAPTGGSKLGSGKWQAGLAALAFFKSNPVVQVGSLLTWQTSFAGSENKPDISILTPQIFFMWQLGGGIYLRSTGTWVFDLTDGDYNIPIGLGIGKVIKSKAATYNIFMEPQYSALSQGVGQPKVQLYIGFSAQFK